MENIPITKRAQLTAQMAVKMEPSLDKDIRILKAQGVDIAELVRTYLRREIPKIRKKLGTA